MAHRKTYYLNAHFPSVSLSVHEVALRLVIFLFLIFAQWLDRPVPNLPRPKRWGQRPACRSGCRPPCWRGLCPWWACGPRAGSPRRASPARAPPRSSPCATWCWRAQRGPGRWRSAGCRRRPSGSTPAPAGRHWAAGRPACCHPRPRSATRSTPCWRCSWSCGRWPWRSTRQGSREGNSAWNGRAWEGSQNRAKPRKRTKATARNTLPKIHY